MMMMMIIIIIIIILDNYKVIILAKNKRLLAKNRPSKTKTITFKCNLRSFACLFKFVDEWKDNDDDDSVKVNYAFGPRTALPWKKRLL